MNFAKFKISSIVTQRVQDKIIAYKFCIYYTIHANTLTVIVM